MSELSTISKSNNNLATIKDNMALKRIVDCALLGIYREKPLDTATYYPINVELFKQLSGYSNAKTHCNTISELVVNLEEEIKQTISEAFKTVLRFEDGTKKGVYHPITVLATDKKTGELFVKFSQELISLVQGDLESIKIDEFKRERTIRKFGKGKFYQQDPRMLETPASIHAMYDLIARELWRGEFELDYATIREKLELDYTLCGRVINKYKNSADFRRNILDKTLVAMKELLAIELEYFIRKGKKGVYAFRFRVFN